MHKIETSRILAGKVLTLQLWQINPLFSIVNKLRPLMLLWRLLSSFMFTVLAVVSMNNVQQPEKKRPLWIGPKNVNNAFAMRYDMEHLCMASTDANNRHQQPASQHTTTVEGFESFRHKVI
nr:hypothetical protein [Tanacetum cinerariifolium]